MFLVITQSRVIAGIFTTYADAEDGLRSLYPGCYIDTTVAGESLADYADRAGVSLPTGPLCDGADHPASVCAAAHVEDAAVMAQLRSYPRSHGACPCDRCSGLTRYPSSHCLRTAPSVQYFDDNTGALIGEEPATPTCDHAGDCACAYWTSVESGAPTGDEGGPAVFTPTRTAAAGGAAAVVKPAHGPFCELDGSCESCECTGCAAPGVFGICGPCEVWQANS